MGMGMKKMRKQKKKQKQDRSGKEGAYLKEHHPSPSLSTHRQKLLPVC
jgi:hypothetical protein